MRYRTLSFFSLVVLYATLSSCQAVVGDKLTSEQMKTLVNSHQAVFLLDVRTPVELRENGMIQGATNIPLNELPGRLNEVPKNKKVVTICALGVRAKKASDLLAQNGYTPPQTFAMADWTASGYPVTYPK
jgi:rhodanese-related sulfurtransferase